MRRTSAPVPVEPGDARLQLDAEVQAHAREHGTSYLDSLNALAAATLPGL